MNVYIIIVRDPILISEIHGKTRHFIVVVRVLIPDYKISILIAKQILIWPIIKTNVIVCFLLSQTPKSYRINFIISIVSLLVFKTKLNGMIVNISRSRSCKTELGIIILFVTIVLTTCVIPKGVNILRTISIHCRTNSSNLT